MLIHWLAGIARQTLTLTVAKAARTKVPHALDAQATWLAIILVRAYQQTLSPWLGRQCLFRPSCSCRAIELLNRLGWTRGIQELDEQLHRCCGTFTIRATQDGFLELETIDGCIVPQSELSDFVLSQYGCVNRVDSNFPTSLEQTHPMR
jgi:putative component of membrane protein insertase Oxa1/YidC/SpoIIIJ protein YidD